MKEEQKFLNYNFFYWGPYLFKCKFDLKKGQELLKKAKKLKTSANSKLAGVIEKELEFERNDIIWFANSCQNIFQAYLESSYNWYGRKIADKLLIKNLWINYMKQGEFNPPHTHTEDLSFVIFLKIPENLKIENKKYVGTSGGPGSISFHYGLDVVDEKRVLNISTNRFFPEEGDMFIFPATLTHWVYPFKSKGERISVSGNISLVKLNDNI